MLKRLLLMKMYVLQTMRPKSGFRIASNLPQIEKMTIVTISLHDVIVPFFWRWSVFLVKFSYWSKFRVSIIAGSRVITIFFYKGLTRNREVGNTPVWVLLNIWRVRDTKLAMNVSNKMLLKAAKSLGYNFYHFWIIKRKATGFKRKLGSKEIKKHLL